jgi:uncharacterized protein (UPF0216 family)
VLKVNDVNQHVPERRRRFSALVDKKLLQVHLQQHLVNGGSKNTVVERRETREVATSTDFGMPWLYDQLISIL